MQASNNSPHTLPPPNLSPAPISEEHIYITDNYLLSFNEGIHLLPILPSKFTFLQFFLKFPLRYGGLHLSVPVSWIKEK